MKVLIILFCLLFALSLFGERLTTFPRLSKPELIRVGDNLICINEGAVVYLYDLNTFKQIKKFGRRGEGPGEFSTDLIINILKEKIMIESRGKLSFYSLKGDLIKEMRRLPEYRKLKILEDRYVASSGILSKQVYHNAAKILDADFYEIKTFYQDEARYHQQKQKTRHASTWIFDVSEKKCFIVGSHDFKIDVFNKNGDSLYTISLKYEKVKISQEDIDAWFNRIKKRLGLDRYYLARRMVRWPEFFPAIRDLMVDNGHVYVITYGRKQGKSECFIFNLEGKPVKKTWLPLKDYDGVAFFPYSIKNNFLYQLIDNEEEEVWELHRFSIVDMDDAVFKMSEKIKEKENLSEHRFKYEWENLSENGFKKELDTYLTRSTKKDVFSGVVLVAKEGKTIFKKAYGMADRELNIPNTLNTRFSLASINKMFTAVAVAQLVAQGKLSYDDLIGKYLGADWVRPEVGEKVKIYHLLTHTSGMGEYLTEELLGKYLTTEDYKALTRVQTLSYEPGAKWEYCNTGFIFLGAIIKKVSGANYEEYIKKHIFEPAGMERTLISSLDKGLADVAMAYGKVDNEGSRQKTVLAGKVNGSSAGGGYSTGEDLLKFATALEANKLITKESAKLLMSAKPGLNAKNYGYGFFIYKHPILGLVVGHGGVAPGVSSNFRMFVDIGYTMIILSNYDKASLKVWSIIQLLLPLK